MKRILKQILELEEAVMQLQWWKVVFMCSITVEG